MESQLQPSCYPRDVGCIACCPQMMSGYCTDVVQCLVRARGRFETVAPRPESPHQRGSADNSHGYRDHRYSRTFMGSQRLLVSHLRRLRYGSVRVGARLAQRAPYGRLRALSLRPSRGCAPADSAETNITGSCRLKPRERTTGGAPGVAKRHPARHRLTTRLPRAGVGCSGRPLCRPGTPPAATDPARL